MRSHARKFIILAFLLTTPSLTLASLPPPTGYVDDFAHVLDPSIGARLENILSSFETKTGDEVVIVTVTSLDGRPVEDFAVDLYKTWGIGKKGKDNGVLILISPSDRQMRIEVGYGLEGVINDALAGRIIREKMIPPFKEGRYDSGILNGTMTVLQLIAKDRGVELSDIISDTGPVYTPKGAKKGILHTLGSVLMFLFLAYLFIRHPWLFLIFLSGMGRGGGRSSGFGGGFGGFGGGLSGGGGASGRW